MYKQADMTANPSKYPQGGFKNKPCKWCKETFTPIAPSHLFCSDFCKDRSYSNSYYLKAYGLTMDEVENLWTKLCIDHDHETGKVRGALCHNCNRALGLFKDDKKRLLSAISYLEGATTIPSGSTLK